MHPVRRLQLLAMVIVAQTLIMPGLPAAEKIFVKGNSTPTVGTITKVDDNAVYIDLSGVGGTSLQRAKIERVEIPRPADLAAGLKASKDGKFADAVKTLEPYHVKYRGLPEPWVEEATARLGDSYLAVKDWAKARDLFLGMRKFYPQSEFKDLMTSGLAQALYGMSKPEDALKLLEPMVLEREKDESVGDEQNRALGKAYVTLGRCYAASKNNDQALNAFLSTTTIYYKDPVATSEALYESALVFEKMENLPRAKGQLEDYMRDFPGGPLAADAKKKLDSLNAVK